MIFAAKTIEKETIKRQISRLTGVDEKNIADKTTVYPGITILTLNKYEICTSRSLRHINVLYIDEASSELLSSLENVEQGHIYGLLQQVEANEQFEYLKQLLYQQRS